MMCVSVCGCSNAPASPEPTPTVFKVEIEDAEPVVTTLLYTGDADALETVSHTARRPLAYRSNKRTDSVPSRFL